MNTHTDKSLHINIRPIVETDFPKWSPLWDLYNAFYNRNVDAEVTKVSWARFLQPHEPVFAKVAELDGKIVGFVHYLYHRHTAMVAPICYLQDLYTIELLRGRGVAKRLIENVYEQAKADGAARVYWQTHQGNEQARILYDKVAKHSGFIIYQHSLETKR